MRACLWADSHRNALLAAAFRRRIRPAGKGKTVIRGGWGRYYYHSGQFTNGLDASAGAESINLSPTNWGGVGPLLASNLSSIDFNATPAAPAAVDSKDDRQPYTDSYSVTLSQRLPWTSLMELSYVGNRSRDLQNTSGAGSNINLVPAGSMLGEANPDTANADKFRPLQGYQDLNLATNNLYANYNAFQMTWARQRGSYTMSLNYTFQKALGIVSPSGGQANLDPFNLRNNYGIQPGNRTHLFNAAYSIVLPSPIRNNKIAAGLVNGWQVSGIAQWQSGANLTFNGGGNDNFNMQLNNAIIPGSISAANPRVFRSATNPYWVPMRFSSIRS